ncbi:MAG: ABC transporter permease subunit [Chloroflexi bacterium]|nr:ABC transporter permease subunit [Chloroflexota bacterium]
MNNNILKHEFKMHLRSAITWSLAAMAVALLYLSLFPSFAKDAALLNEMMANFPPEFLAAFGMNEIDFSQIMGFFTFVYLFIQILLAIQAANYGFALVSIEERELTADFLLSKPLTRSQILTSKLLAALGSLAVTEAVVWASTFAFVNAFKGESTYNPVLLAKMLLGLAVFQLFFLSVGLLISLLVRRVRSVTPYAMGLAFGMYVLGAFGDMLGESMLEKITPFKHFDANYIIKHGNFDMPLVMVSVATIVISVIASYWLYIRRDIPSVS